ncbi:MAG: HEPN domain-containing protein [Rikenellaceae bacterium]
MKRSIKHLPKQTQKELITLVDLIVKKVKGCEMIILFGSYARKGYVVWDEYFEKGIRYSYQSDYDLLVVVSQSNIKIAEQLLDRKVEVGYAKKFSDRVELTPTQYVVEDINRLNKELEIKQYFYTDIIKEGIRIYDTKKYKLAKPRELSFAEIKDFAEEYFKVYYNYGVGFFRHGYDEFEYGDYKLGSFLLHQTCENFYHAISLVFTNYRPKCHKLEKLYKKYQRFSGELLRVFPRETEFEKHCFQILCDAYIKGRYDTTFVVTKEEYEYLLGRIEYLKELTERICRKKIASYDTLIE